ncbi:hypothetical protein J8273_0326 [Carpediemonas membranifera]|uniref:Uncharacterized protein n=1 Tax=Carpediemonas membranifera TaxID=201153 RepID=A0A8J6E4Z0_9EUKA|nr:hypothetical protein J8273_0326 [Carpediemonas membranifera]|eukprot:KAG9395107.1 hypothetical protein J8273_0326 [Carpediemonas membranifera]
MPLPAELNTPAAPAAAKQIDPPAAVLYLDVNFKKNEYRGYVEYTILRPSTDTTLVIYGGSTTILKIMLDNELATSTKTLPFTDNAGGQPDRTLLGMHDTYIKRSEYYRQHGTHTLQLTGVPVQPSRPRTKAVVRVYFGCADPEGAAEFHSFVGTDGKWDRLFIAHGTEAGPTWFPTVGVAGPAPLSVARVNTRHDSSMVTIATGDLVGRKHEGTAASFAHQTDTLVHPSDVAVVVGRLSIWADPRNEAYGGTRAGDPTREAGVIMACPAALPVTEAQLAITAHTGLDAMQHLERAVSAPPPARAVRMVIVPTILAAVSAHGVILLPPSTLCDMTVPETQPTTAVTIYQAVARQLFGVCFHADSRAQWVLEGAVGFLTADYIEQTLGKNTADAWLLKVRLTALTASGLNLHALDKQLRTTLPWPILASHRAGYAARATMLMTMVNNRASVAGRGVQALLADLVTSAVAGMVTIEEFDKKLRYTVQTTDQQPLKDVWRQLSSIPSPEVIVWFDAAENKNQAEIVIREHGLNTAGKNVSIPLTLHMYDVARSSSTPVEVTPQDRVTYRAQLCSSKRKDKIHSHADGLVPTLILQECDRVNRSPVLWVELDPGNVMAPLTNFRPRFPTHYLVQQLHVSSDLRHQMAAVAELAGRGSQLPSIRGRRGIEAVGTSNANTSRLAAYSDHAARHGLSDSTGLPGVVQTLLAILIGNGSTVDAVSEAHFKLQEQAALAIAHIGNVERTGSQYVDALIGVYSAVLISGTTATPPARLACCGGDMRQYALQRALLKAISLCRDVDGETSEAVIRFMTKKLDHARVAEPPYSPAVLEAEIIRDMANLTRPPDDVAEARAYLEARLAGDTEAMPQTAATVLVGAVMDALARDSVAGSANNVLTVSALDTLAHYMSSAVTMVSQRPFVRYLAPDHSEAVRAAAIHCMALVAVYSGAGPFAKAMDDAAVTNHLITPVVESIGTLPPAVDDYLSDVAQSVWSRARVAVLAWLITYLAGSPHPNDSRRGPFHSTPAMDDGVTRALTVLLGPSRVSLNAPLTPERLELLHPARRQQVDFLQQDAYLSEVEIDLWTAAHPYLAIRDDDGTPKFTRLDPARHLSCPVCLAGGSCCCCLSGDVSVYEQDKADLPAQDAFRKLIGREPKRKAVAVPAPKKKKITFGKREPDPVEPKEEPRDAGAEEVDDTAMREVRLVSTVAHFFVSLLTDPTRDGPLVFRVAHAVDGLWNAQVPPFTNSRNRIPFIKDAMEQQYLTETGYSELAGVIKQHDVVWLFSSPLLDHPAAQLLQGVELGKAMESLAKKLGKG